MITRIKNYEKRPPSRDAKKVYIFCEGKGTEPEYFRFFEGLSSNLQLIVVPPESGTDPLKLMALAKRDMLDKENPKYLLDYLANDTVWFVIDTDTWEEEGKIATLREFCLNINNEISETYSKPSRAWNVVQSNPSFEIWLYYHIFENRPNQKDVDVFPTFKAYVGNVISGGFDFQRDPAKIQLAVYNSKRNDDRTADGTPALFTTEVYELAEVIIPFVRLQVERLRGKMM